MSRKPGTYSREKFRVLSVMPGDGWEVIYVDDNKVERADPADFIGIADEWTETYDSKTGELLKTDKDDPISIVVGILIGDDGGTYICDEDANFVRLQRIKKQ